MTEFCLSKFEQEQDRCEKENPETEGSKEIVSMLTKHKVETKLAFTKCKNISRNHTILIAHDKSFEMLAIKPLFINKKEVKFRDGFISLKNSDKITFPCETCHMPHVYHLIVPTGDA